MEAKTVSTGVHNQLIESKAYHTDQGESGKFSPSVLDAALSEDPLKIRQPRLLSEKPKAAIINYK